MAMEAGPPEECLLAETALVFKVLQEIIRLAIKTGQKHLSHLCKLFNAQANKGWN